METSLAEINADNQRLQLQLQEVEHKFEAAAKVHNDHMAKNQSVIDNLEARLNESTLSAEVQRTLESDRLHSHIGELEAKLREAMEQIPSREEMDSVEVMKSQIEHGRAVLGALQSRNDDLEQLKQSHETQISDLTAKVTSLIAVEERMGSLVSEMDAVKSELAATKSAKNEIEAALNKIETEYETSQRHTASLKSENELLKQHTHDREKHSATNENANVDDVNRPRILRHTRESAAKSAASKLPDDFVVVPNSRRNLGRRAKPSDESECNQQ